LLAFGCRQYDRFPSDNWALVVTIDAL